MSDNEHNHKEDACEDKPSATEIVDIKDSASPRKHQCKPSEQGRYRPSWDRYIELFATVVIAIFTAVLWWTSNGQWKEMERQRKTMEETLETTKTAADATRDAVKLADKTAERQLRAYIAVVSGGMQVVTLTQGGLGIGIHIELKNSGQTPGYDFTTWIKKPEILDKDVVPFGAPTPIEQRNGTSIVGPGASVHINWTLPITETDLAAIQSGAKNVFVWGGADYRDIFEQKRYFIFRDTNAQGHFTSIGNVLALAPHKLGYEGN